VRTVVGAVAASLVLALPTSALASTHVSYASNGTVNLIAFGVLSDYRFDVAGTPFGSVGTPVGPTGKLAAGVFADQPLFGDVVDFYVNGAKVCSGTVGVATLPLESTIYAECSDPAAIARAVAAGGYEARAWGLSASAGLAQTGPETATP
jgi:hypothetical protein